MKKNLFVIVCLLVLFGAGCSVSGGKYTITIFDSENKPVVTCVFEGKDVNGDGVIEQSELTSFEETGPNIYSPAIGFDKGWQKEVDIKDIPIIKHGLKDIQAFKFNQKEFATGNKVIEYRTNTKDMVKVGPYYFWRSAEIKENGKKFGIFSGVSDGTKGLELSMRGTEKYTMKIEPS
jgi:hypothetical protein